MSESPQRGRPKGSLNKAPKFRHYRPKKWLPVFSEIVSLSAMGLSNTELGIKYNYSPQQISNILCTEQAEEIRKGIRAGIDSSNSQTIAERVANLQMNVLKVQEKALARVATFMESDNIFQKAPIEAIDRAFKALQGVKGLNPETPQSQISGNTINNTNILMVADSDFARLTRAAEISSGIPQYDPTKASKEILSVG